LSQDAAVLSSGQILRKPEFVISSSQTSWKPYFLPLNKPLVIRASGEMQPVGGTTATGPGGIAVPKVAQWVYPGTSTIIVNSEHPLYVPSMPYQALIGRLCGAKECGQPFMVGAQRTICPQPQNDRLELWINHIVEPPGLLGSRTPLRMETFDLQSRRGEYRFELTLASGGCG
jgi:hypothetical protein